MHVDNFDALRVWLTRVLTHICEAEPATLSKYVCVLVKKDVKGKDPKGYFTEQLEVFLQDETSGFIDKLFKALESKEYMSEEILAELSERREKKDKKRAKAEKSEKTDKVEKISDKAHHRHNRTGSVHSNSGSTGAGESERHPYTTIPSSQISSRYPQPSQSRHRTPSPAPRRHKMTRSRSRSPVHRRRRDSRDSYERGNHSTQAERNTAYSSIATVSSSGNPAVARTVPFEVGDSSSSLQNHPLRQHIQLQPQKQAQTINTNIIPITPVMSTGITPSHSQTMPVSVPPPIHSLQGANVSVPAVTPVYTPSIASTAIRGRVQRCRDFDEKGYCMRGDLCPYDHGSDPVVVENVNFSKVLSYPSTASDPSLPKPQSDEAASVQEKEVIQEKKSNESEEAHVEDVRTLLTDRGRTRPTINRPVNLSRNVVEVPLVDDKSDTPATSEMKANSEMQKDIFEKRAARFGSNSNAADQNESGPVDLRARLAGSRPQQPYSNRGNGHFSYRGRRGFGGGRPNFGRGFSGGEGSCSLGVTQIPPELNTIGHLNSHFRQFGEVMNIQVAHGDDPRNALITFKTPAAAMKAYRSPEPILSNRFIRTHLPSDDNESFGHGRGRGRGRGTFRGGESGGGRVPVKRRLGLNTAASDGRDDENSGSNPKRRLHHRLGRNFDESSSESDEDWGVPDDNSPVARRRTTLDSNGADEFATDDIDMREAREEMRRKEELAERQEAAAQMRAEQLLALERMRKRKELRMQQAQLYNKMKEQIKTLNKKLNNYSPDTPQRAAIQKTIGVVETKLQELEKQLDIDSESPATVQNAQRRILDLELEQYNREQEKLDTTDVKRRLTELRRRLSVYKKRADVYGNAAFGSSLYPTRAQTKLDKRPRTLLVSALQSDVSVKILLQSIAWSGAQIEKYEYLDNEKVLSVTFRTRADAEFVSGRFHDYKGKPLRIEWGKTIEKSASTSTNPDGSVAVSDGASGEPSSSGGNANEDAPNEPDAQESDVNNSNLENSGADDSKTKDIFSDDFNEYEDEMEEMMTVLGENYDPEFSGEFGSRSPVVVRAESESSSATEDEDEEVGEDQDVVT